MERFTSAGAVVAIVVLVFAVLLMVAVVPASPLVLGGMLAGLAVARLV